MTKYAAALSGLRILLRYLYAANYQFVTPTPVTTQRVNRRNGNEIACDLAGVFGWNRPFHLELLPRQLGRELLENGVLSYDGELCKSHYRVSSLDSVLFVHSGFPTDEGDAVFFGPDTYRFVSSLFTIVPTLTNVRRVVDIGCGTGAGGLVIGRMLPKAQITMVDINKEALECAALNAEEAGFTKFQFVESDLLGNVDGDFDLIVSNPPYLSDSLQRTYRHGGGARGESLSVKIVRTALDRLSPGGRLILYSGSAIIRGLDHLRSASLRAIEGSKHLLEYREIDPDVFSEELENEVYRDADRIAAVLITIKKVSSNARPS